MNADTRPNILLTIDVEDWFQVENLRPWFPPGAWNRQELRVERNTNDLMDLLDSMELPPDSQKPAAPVHTPAPRATFFILGWIAKRLPNLVREIQKRGHEVASHGYNHLMCSRISPEDLKDDLIRSKRTIEDITGVEVKGYRAPNFSISDVALELVRTTGYQYDSSYNNFARHGRYGVLTLNGKNKAGEAVRIEKDFAELPISNLTVGNQIVPWGGGGYFRLLPLPIFTRGIAHILNRTGFYLFYMHPWEIDPGQPRVKNGSRLSSWRHYLNLAKTRTRLAGLLQTFKRCKFPTCSQYLDDVIKD